MAGVIEFTDCFSAKELDSPNEYPGYDMKQSDGEVPIMLELWGMWSTSSVLLLPGLLWSRVVAPDRVLSMGTYAKLKWLKQNYLTFKLLTYAKA